MLRGFMNRTGCRAALALAVMGAVCLTGCGKQAQKAGGPVQVKTMQVIRRDTPIEYDFTGFIEAKTEAKITSRVSGRVVGKHFTGGEYVEAGTLLFTIDQRNYEANLLNAEAALAKAEAELLRLARDVERYRTLYEQEAISRQTYDMTLSQYRQAVAEVEAKRAAVRNSEIDMEETEVRAPFSGRISTSDMNIGNIVTANTTEMAVMSDLDPVKVSFSMSENEYLAVVKMHEKKASAENQGNTNLDNLTLKLSDGSSYPLKGRVTEVDRSVSQGTGTLTVKAQFPNPNYILLPGLFGRISASAGIRKDAMLIPQRAVKEMLYKKFVFVVNAENKTEMKEVQMGVRTGRLWLVESGLKGDEKIVVEGVQKVNADTPVNATPMTEADLDTGEAK